MTPDEIKQIDAEVAEQLENIADNASYRRFIDSITDEHYSPEDYGDPLADDGRDRKVMRIVKSLLRKIGCDRTAARLLGVYANYTETEDAVIAIKKRLADRLDTQLAVGTLRDYVADLIALRNERIGSYEWESESPVCGDPLLCHLSVENAIMDTIGVPADREDANDDPTWPDHTAIDREVLIDLLKESGTERASIDVTIDELVGIAAKVLVARHRAIEQSHQE